jgi:hypothetical protein
MINWKDFGLKNGDELYFSSNRKKAFVASIDGNSNSGCLLEVCDDPSFEGLYSIRAATRQLFNGVLPNNFLSFWFYKDISLDKLKANISEEL